jgi:heat-inducible transcriptional repressor
MNLTERQEKILDVVVKEYVNSAQPVSSQLLEKRYDFGVSPATIRNEMQKLTDGGFLSQPHTSAGRIPTDKGYRFFVNNLLEEKAVSKDLQASGQKKSLDAMIWEGNEVDDTFRFMQGLTRYLAEKTRVLALNYFENEDFFWKEGWEEVLQEPEFEERENILNFADFLKSLENHIEKVKISGGVNVCIGKENPFPKAKNFTVISSRYKLPNGQEGVISLLGPKRMAYDKNLNLINSLMQLLDNM